MGYNTGDTYEEIIFDICQNKGITPPGSTRAGASAKKADVEFIHQGATYKLEIKNKMNPDYGQRILDYDVSLKTWDWAVNDQYSQYLNGLNVKSFIDPNFVPVWYQKRSKNSTTGRFKANQGAIYSASDLIYDQQGFETGFNPISNQAVFNYYAMRNTHYIQVEDSGFYHLDADVASLGTTQYDGVMAIRFRLKRHSSEPIYNCSFLGVLKQTRRATRSTFNIESNPSQSFPLITP